MRVLHVLDHSVPLHSGYAFRTLSILREQRQLGWSVVGLTTPKQGATDAADEQVEGFRFLRTPAPAGAGLLAQMRATAKRLEAAVAALQPDLVHAHSPVLTVLPALRVGRRRGLPVVYEVRATWEDAAVDHGSTLHGSLRYRLSRALETFALRRVSHVTTICEGLRDEIVGRGIDPERVTVIPNAVDSEHFAFRAPPDAELARRLGLDDEALTVGFIGSFYGYEGLDLLLEAVALLGEREMPLQCVLVGGGPEQSRLEALAESLGIEDRVRFTGRVSHDEVSAYYSLIDILVYARKRTRLTELVTPLKPLEAMAQGNIFVASDVGGHRELVTDGETGFLFPAGDVPALAEAILATWRARESWDAMRERAREHVRRERNWTVSVAGYREAYGRALETRGRDMPV